MKKKNVTKRVLQIMAGWAVVSILSILLDSNGLQAQEANVFVADTTVSSALSSCWEGEAFTAVFLISGSGNYAKGEWKLSIKPPFPHPISGLDDSFVQTAFGIALLNMEASAGMSWLLRAAMKDQIDAIMILAIAYANNQQVKNTVEAERWFRRAIELGNPDAETKINDMLAGKSVNPSIKASNTYNFGFSLVNKKE